MKDWQSKLLLALVAAMLAGAAWYLKAVDRDVRELRHEIAEMQPRLERAAAIGELLAGGDPTRPRGR